MVRCIAVKGVNHFSILAPANKVLAQKILADKGEKPAWDLTAADGSANGWNYEDGTFSPGMVRERIHAINTWNTKHPANSIPNPYNGTDDPLKPSLHPYFNGTFAADSICDGNDDCPYQAADCETSWESVDGDSHRFEVKYAC